MFNSLNKTVMTWSLGHIVLVVYLLSINVNVTEIYCIHYTVYSTQLHNIFNV
jgi:hypothetical protein